MSIIVDHPLGEVIVMSLDENPKDSDNLPKQKAEERATLAGVLTLVPLLMLALGTLDLAVKIIELILRVLRVIR